MDFCADRPGGRLCPHALALGRGVGDRAERDIGHAVKRDGMTLSSTGVE